MDDQAKAVNTIKVNLSPDGFHMWAQHYFKCMKDFISPHRFSPVPFFLVCRAIELQLKAYHLQTKRQSYVKNKLGHNLIRSYSSLDSTNQILTNTELVELERANEIYSKKGFEYFAPIDAMRGYSNFPNLDVLIDACERLLGHGEFIIPPSRIRSSWFIDLIDKFRRWLTSSSRI
jgi:hypothetical protein